MEIIQHCNLCGGQTARILLTGSDRLHGGEEQFSLMECQECGLIYLNPRPGVEELDRYYPEDYQPFLKAIADEPTLFKRLDRRYGLYKRCNEVIKRAGHSGRVLDIGCATGIFLEGMRVRGWQPDGVELSEFAANYARERFGLPVFTGTLEEALYPDKQFDLITMWDVLEHVPDPGSTLTEINRILKPGGWLVLSLPNPLAWERYWFSQYWAGWDVPRHFQLFTPVVLERYLRQAGLQMAEITSFTGRHGVLVLSIQMWLSSQNVQDRTKRLVMTSIKSLPARILTYPFYALADALNRSSIMVVFARKIEP
jgi:2-polyprenyl-3-methyl-5-hydroxy-6-metoxy-1,4-benzoquinol methylase